ncbi:Rv3654c family TadE-like protein [Antricoccus suffuscus]|nr:Rv3654c family TadE-like protein [Antricoccus suffuscus]
MPTERGSGTIWVVAMAMVLCVVALSVMLLGLAQTARHKANSAADLAALAAAQVLIDGTGSPCDVASGNAAANGARITSCAVDGEVVLIAVSVDVHLGRFGLGTATATARAGPVDLAP